MSMRPLVLTLADPAVKAAMSDFPTLQRWEVLRRRRALMSAVEFAAACSISLSEAGRSLDLLVDAGLVVRKRATTQRRYPTFEVASYQVMVTYDMRCPEQNAWVDAQRHALRGHSRREIDQSFLAPNPSGKPRIFTERYRVVPLTDEERERIYTVIQRAFDLVAEIERDAEERMAAESNARGPEDGPTQPRLNYMIALHMVSVGGSALPLPQVSVVDKRLADEWLSRLTAHPRLVLSARELETASQLATGASRPAVARSLGISANTVAATTKRIYAKLRVKSRAEFAARMRDRATT